MLEPTKEPVKPISAAEMIASIGQTPPVVTENSDSVQVSECVCLSAPMRTCVHPFGAFDVVYC